MARENATVDLLRDLIKVRTENPPGNERDLAVVLRGRLKEHRIGAVVDPIAPRRANLVARIEGSRSGPTLLFNGHLDTVPAKGCWEHNPFAGEVSCGKVFGLGSADMKGAVAAMVGAAVRAQADSRRMRGVLVLAFVADEERTNLGTIDLLRRYKKPAYAVIGEPTELNLAVSNRGTVRMKVRTAGVAGHCSNPKAGVNAIYSMARVVARLEKYAREISRGPGHYTTKPSLSITMIHGGAAENVIPDACEIMLDRRLLAGENEMIVEKEIAGILEEEKKKDRSFSYTYETISSMVPWKAKEKSLLLECSKTAYRECVGSRIALRDLGGTSEAGLFAARGIDTLICGPASIAMAHQPDEYVEIDQLEKAQEFYYRVIQRLLF